MIDPSESAIEFVRAVARAVLTVKPEANQYEIIGTVYLILNKTIETFKNEQQEISSPGEGTPRIGTEPEQIQGTGTIGGIEKGAERFLDQQRGSQQSGGSEPKLTSNGKRKRR